MQPKRASYDDEHSAFRNENAVRRQEMRSLTEMPNSQVIRCRLGGLLENAKTYLNRHPSLSMGYWLQSPDAERSHMRIIVLCGLLLAVFSVNLVAGSAPADPKPIPEPTPEQLTAAKEAYAKFGAEHDYIAKIHLFLMPQGTTDADLKGLPDLPFQFGLDLICPKVTDAGLKELTALKNLTTLYLDGTKVTDNGLKELKNLKNLMSHFP
jgi:hypothetical protein